MLSKPIELTAAVKSKVKSCGYNNIIRGICMSVCLSVALQLSNGSTDLDDVFHLKAFERKILCGDS